MFGLFRTYLALCVLASHILAIPYIGSFAVQGFFVLSGYLMTLIMAESYGYSRQGTWAFAMNRALRLFPSYWVILVLTVLAIVLIGEEASRTYRKTMYLPDTPGVWVQNIFMTFVAWNPQWIQPRLSPATWALTIELFFYAAIGLGLFRSKAMTWAVVGVGVLWQGYIIATALLDMERAINAFLGGALPFGIGGLLYHHRDTLARFRPGVRLTYVVFIPTFALFGVFCVWLEGQGLGILGNGIGYMSMLLCAATVVALTQSGTPEQTRRDKFIGDFSYHIYIAHWAVAFVVANVLFGISEPRPMPEGLGVFAVTLIVCAVLSYALTTLVDTPIEALRRRIKRKRMQSH